MGKLQVVEEQEEYDIEVDTPEATTEGSAEPPARDGNADSGKQRVTKTRVVRRTIPAPPTTPRRVEIGRAAHECLLDGEVLPEGMVVELVVQAILDLQAAYKSAYSTGTSANANQVWSSQVTHT